MVLRGEIQIQLEERESKGRAVWGSQGGCEQHREGEVGGKGAPGDLGLSCWCHFSAR